MRERQTSTHRTRWVGWGECVLWAGCMLVVGGMDACCGRGKMMQWVGVDASVQCMEAVYVGPPSQPAHALQSQATTGQRQ